LIKDRIEGRKFDIRCYILLTTCNGNVKGYWYEDFYIRTASELYNLDDISDQMIHLTNDAVQKKGKSYGKF
jgi:tubulin--tyrosine ligase